MRMGEPEDRPGECNAHLHIGDDYGDHHATMRCDRPAGHADLHCERFSDHGHEVVIVQWKHDERGEAGCSLETPR